MGIRFLDEEPQTGKIRFLDEPVSAGEIPQRAPLGEGGTVADIAARVSPFRMLGMSEQTERELAAGGARGVGSIAATVGEVLGVKGIPSRAEMDQYLAQTMGVSPQAGAYQAGQIASEIGATLPVPLALGAAAARIPGVRALAPAISSAGFSPGALTGMPNVLARVAGGALAGGASAGVVNPEDISKGAAIGAGLGPAAQFVLGAGRTIADRFVTPAVGAANRLLQAGGEDLANVLRRTAGMETTPGFTPTLAERAYEGGIRSPSLARLEKSIEGVDSQVQNAYNAQVDRVTALRQQLDGVENQLAQQTGALQPEAQAGLAEVRNQLLRSLNAEEAALAKSATELEQSLRDVGRLPPGETLATRAAELRKQVRATVVEPAYNRAFKAAGDTRIDVSPVLAEAERILGKPLTEFAPETAPSIVRELLQLAPKAPAPQPLGAGKISSRIVTRSEAPQGPATATLEQLDAIRRVINSEISAAARGTSPLSATEARNLSQLHRTLDESVAGSTTLSDDAKNLYAVALESYRTKFAPRFKDGATAQLLQPSTFNQTRLMPNDAVQRYLSNAADAQQFVTTFADDAAAKTAMAEGIESLFREAVVDRVTKRVNPDAAAKFLSDPERARAIEVLEANGISVTPRLQAVQSEAEALSRGFDNIATLRKEIGGDTAPEIVDRLLKEPGRMQAAMIRLNNDGKAALSQATADKITNMINSGNAPSALKFMLDNEATVKQALGGKGVWTDLKDLTEQYIQLQKVVGAFEKSPSLAPAASTLTNLTRRLTPADFNTLRTIAEDIKRADAVTNLAGISKAETPQAGRAVTEMRKEEGVTPPSFLSNIASTARAAWSGLEGRMNKKVAAEITHFMYRDPDAAIAALDAAQKLKKSRQLFSGSAGRGVTIGGAQVGTSEQSQSENALAR